MRVSEVVYYGSILIFVVQEILLEGKRYSYIVLVRLKCWCVVGVGFYLRQVDGVCSR